jgi:LacI family transcriptional regulator
MGTRMKDIAQDLGVSLMTVSKALRGHQDISDETRRRVLKRVEELNYRPNWVARSLVTGRTQLIGVVIPDLMHSFFAEVARAIDRTLEPLSYHTVISNSGEDPTAEERQIEFLLARNVDGLIIASAQRDARKGVLETLDKRKIPYVLIDRMVSGASGTFVGVKDEEIGVIATNHLIDQGFRRIAHIRGPAITTGAGRLKGYRSALAKAGRGIPEEFIVEGHFDDENGYKAMRQLLELKPRPDAVFCYNDPVAAGAIKAVLETGLNVPNDVAVIGVGNIHYADLLRVPLSTIDQSSSAMGEKAAEWLLRSIESKSAVPAEKIFIQPRLVERESTRRR